MFTSTAYASPPAAAPTTTGSGADNMSAITSMLQLFLPIIVVWYFFMIRPQQKRIKDHETMLNALRRGDKVVTAGGVIGTISKVEADNIVVLEVAPDVKIRVMRDTLSSVLTKTVANDNQSNDNAKAAKE